MSELDSLSIEAVRWGFPRWMAIVPVVIVATVAMGLAQMPGPDEPRPEAPFELSSCDWQRPSPTCLEHAPDELRGLPDPILLGTAIESRLVDVLEGGRVSYIDWEIHPPLPFDPNRLPPHVVRMPDPRRGRFIADDEAWYALQHRLASGLPDTLGGWDPLDSGLRLVPLSPSSDAYGLSRVDDRVLWAYRFAEDEVRRRRATAERLEHARRDRWQEDVNDWQRRQEKRDQGNWNRRLLGALLVFLLPFAVGIAYHLRHTSVQVRLTRTHLFIGDDAVLLTELPEDAERLRVVLDGLLPEGFRFEVESDAFFQALVRAVRAQHAAEDRVEDRARLESLGAQRQ